MKVYRPDELLSTSEVAREIGRSIDTIRKYHKDGILIPEYIDIRGGKKTRLYTLKQVKLFIKRNRDWLYGSETRPFSKTTD